MSRGEVTLSAASSLVKVPCNMFTPCMEFTMQLTHSAPLAESDDSGYTFYTQAVDIVGRHLQYGFSDCVM